MLIVTDKSSVWGLEPVFLQLSTPPVLVAQPYPSRTLPGTPRVRRPLRMEAKSKIYSPVELLQLRNVAAIDKLSLRLRKTLRENTELGKCPSPAKRYFFSNKAHN